MKRMMCLIAALFTAYTAGATAWQTNVAGAVDSLGSWVDVATGLIAPTTFDSSGDTWTIQNNMTLATAHTWTVAGSVGFSGTNTRITLSNNDTINIAGNLTINGTGEHISSTTGTFNFVINLGGNLSLAGSSYIAHTGAGFGNGTFNFNGGTTFASPQILTVTSTANPGGRMNYNVLAGSFIQLAGNVSLRPLGGVGRTFTVKGTLNCQGYTLGAGNTGTFVLGAAGTLATGTNPGISASPTASGCIRMTSGRTFPATANYIYLGTIAQTTGTGLPATLAPPATLVINDTAGVTLSRSTTLDSGTVLDFVTGRLAIGAFTLTIKGITTGMNATTNQITGGANSNLTVASPFNLDSFYFNQTTIGTTNNIRTFTYNSTGSLTLRNGMVVNNTLNLYNGTLNDSAYLTMNNATTLNRDNGVLTSAPLWGATGASVVNVRYTTGGPNNLAVTTGLELPTTITNLGSLTVIKPGALITLASSPVANGNITLTSGTLDASPSNYTITANRNWVNNAGATAFTAENGTVVFGGTLAKTVGGIYPTTFNNAQMNDAGSATLTNDMFVNDSLTLLAGLLKTGTVNLVLGYNAAPISGTFSGTSMIVPQRTGRVKKLLAANDTFFFPVGDSLGNFSPIALATASTAFDSGAFEGINLNNIKDPNNANTTDYLNRYWNIADSGMIGYNTTVTGATYVPGDVVGLETDISGGEYGGALPWNKYGPTNTATHTLTTGAMTDSVFQVTGISTEGPVVTINPTSTVTCTGSDTLTAVATRDSPFTYIWSPATGLSATTGATVVVTSTVAGTYYVSITDGNGFTAIDSVNISINPLPTVSGISVAPSPACVGSAVTLAATGAAGTGSLVSYNWSGPGGYTATGTTPTQPYTIPDTTAAGIYSLTVTYVGVGCTSAPVASAPLSVNTPAGAITGGIATCLPGTVTLSDSTAVGTGTGWLSRNTAVATVDAVTGMVTSVAFGTTEIIYSATNPGCGTTSDSLLFTVTAAPAITPGALAAVCAGTNASLPYTSSNIPTTYGIVWTGSPAGLPNVATGTALPTTPIPVTVLSTCAPGTYTGFITVANPCGSGTPVAITLTVNPAPAAISGSTTVCIGATATLSDSTTGGTWSTTATGIAIGSASGTFSGIGAGTDTVTYTVLGCSTSSVVTVNPLPAIIADASAFCVGNTVSLIDSTPGGTWTSGSTSMATVDVSGNVTGVAAGMPSITYTLASTGCATSTTVTVEPLPASISGTANICLGATATFVDTTLGGTWSSSDTTILPVNAGGVATGNAVGGATLTYTSATGCTTTFSVSVNALPASIVGPGVICGGSTGTYTDASGGGTWTSSNPTVATIGTSGIATGIASGTTVLSYTSAAGCLTTDSISVTAPPAAISGGTSVCLGATITLSDSTTGGYWTVSRDTVAYIDSFSGAVSGILTDTVTVMYTLSSGCGSTSLVFTVNPMPGVITGSTAFCAGASATLSDAGIGTWASSNTAVAAVTSGGVVTGVAGGSATITYTLTSSGCSAYDFIDVYAAPSVIGGPSQLCLDNTATVTDSVAGGTWSSSNTAIATIDPSTGTVSPVGLGMVYLTYTLPHGCLTSETVTVSVAPAAITGSATLCTGNTITLADGTTGGIWSVVAGTGTATIDTSGNLTGIGAGTATVSYLLGSACAATSVITVLPTPSAISGPAGLCLGTEITLTDSASGGNWSSSAPATASVTISTGIVTGGAYGTATITYTTACGMSTKTLSVSPAPAAGTISGPGNVCAGGTITLSDTTSGGTWSASNGDVIVTGGTVIGHSAGIDTVRYSVVNGCGTAVATTVITINALPNPGAISGTDSMSVCIGSTLTLTDTADGSTGSWISTVPAVATVSGGIVSTVALGFTTIKYAVTNSCGTGSASRLIHVVTTPVVSTITGPSYVCTSGTSTLSDSATGGTWMMVDTTLAKISVTGIVTGHAAGIDTVKYTITNACGTASTKLAIGVLTAPDSITGTTSFCEGATTTLSDLAAGGIWTSSDTAIAIVNTSGIVHGILGGSVTITYNTGCGTPVTTTLHLAPFPTVGAIIGLDTVCAGSSTTLLDSASGGTWGTSNGNATISTGGVLSGIAGGLDTVIFTVTNACGSGIAQSAILVLPQPVSGIITASTDTLCAGSSLTLTETATGGVWSLSNPSIASIDSVGIVAATGTGMDSAIYTVTNYCGVATSTFTINIISTMNPGTITGPDSICLLQNETLTGVTAGGTWTVTNAVLSLSGDVVTGAAVGKDTVVYSLPNYCGTTTASKTILVKPLPQAGVITDAGSVCMGATITVSESVPGGTWTTSSGNASLSGDSLTGVTAGTDSLIYLVTNFCGTARAAVAVTIIAMPTAGTITGPVDSICVGSTLTLSDSVAGGNWNSLNLAVASVEAGVVTGIAAGLDSIKYLVTNVCGTAVTAIGISVLQAPMVTAVSGKSRACITETPDTLYGIPGGGVWTSSNVMDTILPTGLLLVGAPGQDTLKYTISNSCGSSDSTIVVAVYTKAQCDSLNGVPEIILAGAIKLYPNPTAGMVTIALPESANGLVVTITDLTGNKVFETTVQQGQNTYTVDRLDVAAGAYIVEVTDGTHTYRDKLVVMRR